MGDRTGTKLSPSERAEILEQFAITQTMALQRVLEWMLKQPGANQRMLDGAAEFLSTAHMILQHFGDGHEHEALVRSIEAHSNSILARARLLPDPDALQP